MTGNKLQIKPDNGSRESRIFPFGPHVGIFTKQSMETLMRPIFQIPHRDWILDTISGLPTYLNGLNSIRPEVARAVPGSSLLADLDSWLRYGATEIPSEATLPSITFELLVVLTQLTQYWCYLELLHQGQHRQICRLAWSQPQRVTATSKRWASALGYWERGSSPAPSPVRTFRSTGPRRSG